jgi:hypothetical protein
MIYDHILLIESWFITPNFTWLVTSSTIFIILCFLELDQLKAGDPYHHRGASHYRNKHPIEYKDQKLSFLIFKLNLFFNSMHNDTFLFSRIVEAQSWCYSLEIWILIYPSFFLPTVIKFLVVSKKINCFGNNYTDLSLAAVRCTACSCISECSCKSGTETGDAINNRDL